MLGRRPKRQRMGDPQQGADEKVLRDIVGVVAAHVEGIEHLGDPLIGQLQCSGPGCSDPGRGVTVHRWGDDLWVYVQATSSLGQDEAEQVGQEVRRRVQATLDDLLGIHATTVDVDIAAVREERMVQ